MKLFVQKEEYKSFVENLESLFVKYQDDFKSIKFEDVILLSGFHTNWKKDLIESL